MKKTLLTLAAIIELFSPGCKTTFPQASSTEVLLQKRTIETSLAPNLNIKLLQEREYLIPDSIFDAYIQTIDPFNLKGITGKSVGGYTHENYINAWNKKEEFLEKLHKLDLSDKEISVYATILSTPDVIVFRESIIQDSFFRKALAHERFHKELTKLPEETYEYMREIANHVMSIRYSITYAKEHPELFNTQDIEEWESFIAGQMPELQKKYPWKSENELLLLFSKYVLEQKNPLDTSSIAAELNFEEFYAYLAQGAFKDRVEIVLKQYTPAWNVYEQIKKRTEDLVYYDASLPSVRKANARIYKIAEDGLVPKEFCTDKLEHDVIMIVADYCSSCYKAIPLLEKASNALNIPITYINVSEEEGFRRIINLELTTSATPTLLIGCTVSIGLKTENEYKQMLQTFVDKR